MHRIDPVGPRETPLVPPAVRPVRPVGERGERPPDRRRPPAERRPAPPPAEGRPPEDGGDGHIDVRA